MELKKQKVTTYFFLDSDDVWLPQNIELKINTLKKNETIDWLFGSIELIDENSDKLNSILTGSDKNKAYNPQNMGD